MQSAFIPRYFDSGQKTFMGKTGNFTGDDIVEILVPLRATAERLSTRLFSFFAYQNPEPEIVHHLADTFQQSHYNVGAVVREIFSMDAFYSAKAYRGLVKSPAELTAQTLRATGADARAYLAAANAMLSAERGRLAGRRLVDQQLDVAQPPQLRQRGGATRTDVVARADRRPADGHPG